MSVPNTIEAPGEPLFDGVRVVRHVHRSPSCDVFIVDDERRLARCMAKVLRPDRRSSTKAIRLITNEGRRLVRLAHPNLVRAYEFTNEPRPTIIMEYLDAELLLDVIGRARHGMPWQLVVLLVEQIASVLGYLHAEGYVHMDVKPANISISGQHATLFDLGITHRPGSWGSGWGTRQFLSPEQAAGGDISFASDVWSIGVVLFRMLSGALPFTFGDEVEHPQLTVPAPPILSACSCPDWLADTVDRCLRSDPDDRPTMLDVRSRLRRGERA